MQRCSSLLIIREMQIKTTVRYHLKPIGMAIFKSLQINAGAGMEKKKGTFLHCWWEWKLVCLIWRTVWVFLKNLKTELACDPEIALLGIHLKKILIWKYTVPVFIAALLNNSQDMKMKVTQSSVTLCNPMDYTDHSPGRILERVVFPFRASSQPSGWNPGLPHCRQILYQLSHKGSPRILEWVAYPFFSGSSWPRNWTGICCIAGRFFTNWAIRTWKQTKYPSADKWIKKM